MGEILFPPSLFLSEKSGRIGLNIKIFQKNRNILVKRVDKLFERITIELEYINIIW